MLLLSDGINQIRNYVYDKETCGKQAVATQTDLPPFLLLSLHFLVKSNDPSEDQRNSCQVF